MKDLKQVQLQKLVNAMGELFRNILRGVFYVSVVPLILLMIVTAMDVVARYIFNKSICSALEICTLLLSMLISLALAYTAHEKENVVMTVLVDRLPAYVKKVLNAATSFIGASICYLLATQATIKAVYSMRVGEHIGDLEIPVFPSKFLFAFGFLLSGLALTSHFISAFERKRTDNGEKEDRQSL